MIKYSFLTLLIILFALNMGGGNFAASFAAAHVITPLISVVISFSLTGVRYALFK